MGNSRANELRQRRKHFLRFFSALAKKHTSLFCATISTSSIRLEAYFRDGHRKCDGLVSFLNRLNEPSNRMTTISSTLYPFSRQRRTGNVAECLGLIPLQIIGAIAREWKRLHRNAPKVAARLKKKAIIENLRLIFSLSMRIPDIIPPGRGVLRRSRCVQIFLQTRAHVSSPDPSRRHTLLETPRFCLLM